MGTGQKSSEETRLRSDYPASWYAASADVPKARPELTFHGQCEICVIGGGLAGLTSAFELARRGRSVILLEARRLGWGASGRNGGFVSAGFAEGLANIIRLVGLEEAQALYRLSVEGVDYVRERIAEIDPSIKMGNGWIVVQRYPDADGQRRIADLLNQHFGRDVSVLDPAETRVLLRSDRYFHSRFDPSAFHIHPLRYAWALAAAAEAAGVRIFENTRVARIEASKGAFRLMTDVGSVVAEKVVFCMSSHDRHLSGRAGRAILPVATHVAVTAPLGARAADAVATGAAVSDTRRSGDYYRRITSGRILWGGRITTRVSEPRQLAEKMKSDMLDVYPQLGDPPIEFAWSGLMGYAIHKMPVIGPFGPNRWAATGFGGHGLNTTAMAGLLMARAIAEGDDEWKRFSSFGAPWAGGPVGRLGVQLTSWGMQWRDWLEERRSRNAPEGGPRAS
jgi:glycine/D-amino acid oxidase-like deaminating enzyme